MNMRKKGHAEENCHMLEMISIGITKRGCCNNDEKSLLRQPLFEQS